MTERRVLLIDVLVVDALRFQERPQDLVRRARIYIVGSEQHPPFRAAAFLAHQILDRRNCLLIRCGSRIENVFRQLFTFILHGIEQEAVRFLEDRQHRLARHRGPAAEHGRDLVLRNQLSRLFRKQRPIRRGIDNNGLDLLSHHAAARVDFVEGHQCNILENRFADRHRARQ